MMDQFHGGITEEISNLVKKPLIDFSSNLNPFGPPKGLEKELNGLNIESYPAGYSSLERSLGDFLNCRPENLLPTNGASEAFYFLTLFLRPEVTAVQIPAFSEYENSARAACWAIRHIGSTPGASLDENALYQAVEQSDLIFIGNPNNPDGRLFSVDFIKKLVAYAEDSGTTVILDEAFIDFPGRTKFSLTRFVDDFESLIVVGSLTKIFAVAGLRFGFIAANRKLAARLRRARPPWPINTITSKAIEFCLGQTDYYRNTVKSINRIKEDFVAGLDQAGLETLPSAANYLLAKLPEGFDSTQFTADLLKEGFLIRDCRSFGLGEKYIRLAVKLPEQNMLLLETLRSLIRRKTACCARGG